MALMKKGPEVDDSDSWYCHCCLQKNSNKADTCRTCGRHESWRRRDTSCPSMARGQGYFGRRR